MNYNGLLINLPTGIKWFVGSFVLVLSIGFYTGLLFVSNATSTSSSGLVENYLGNEENDDAEIMKFKKGDREMLTIIHTHVLSMSFIFFLLGGLVWIAKLPHKLKMFLTIEPLISVLLTFGGIYLMWSGWLWMKYVVMFSGFLMTLTFSVSAILVVYQLFLKPSTVIK
ncbi:hypothetical protein [Arenibacter certesii]|uniref:Uncharacterized protein n=1 Tax=Arenibacter certesii TaxID=228955 RepID=A0A918MJG2_9FLAO|nr:hypothetical protein [Arenibacter certesii]GGW26961.1 hypothetical protein GCM10007383_10340 [Arenibacter certesii]